MEIITGAKENLEKELKKKEIVLQILSCLTNLTAGEAISILKTTEDTILKSRINPVRNP